MLIILFLCTIHLINFNLYKIMGADMSAFELDEGVKKDLESVHKDETLSELFNRTMKGMTDVLFQPERYPYSSDDLLSSYITEKEFVASEFNIHIDNLKLHGAKWVRNQASNVCIVYLHTNSRSVVDATEVIPLASVLDGNVVAFDLPGSGKSDGNITLSGTIYLQAIINNLIELNPAIEIVLWARAISTQLAMELMSSFDAPSAVKFLVLDTPFATVEQIVMEAAAKIPMNGIAIPSVFIKFAVSMVRNSVKEQIGTDPYELKPIKCAKLIKTPTFILTADNDPYVSVEMSESVAKAFKGDSWCREFPGGYFDTRDHCLVLSPLGHILKYVSGARSRSRSHSLSAQAKPTLTAEFPETIDNVNASAIDGCDTSRDSHGSNSSNVRGGVVNYNDIVQATDTTPFQRDTDTLPRGDITIEIAKRTVATWTPDEKMSKCGICKAVFGVIRFRHHCRNCGNCLCDLCSATKAVLLHVDMHTPVRICTECVASKVQKE